MNTTLMCAGKYFMGFGVVYYYGYAYFAMQKLPVRLRNIG